MEDGTIVREADEADRDGVWLLTRAFATSFVPTREVFGRSFDLALAAPDALLLVALAPSGRTVGYLLAHVHVTLFADGPVAWVEEIMVDGTARRAGIGRRLVGCAEAWAGARGARYLALATRRAAEFYRALGYEESAAYLRKTL